MRLKFWQKPRSAAADPKPPESGVLVSSSRLAPLNHAATRFMMERMPLRWTAQGRVTESDLALAATTPVLGQYAPQFGWSDDWGLYWDYVDAYLFIPEVAFAVKLKTRMIWKPGFEVEASSERARSQVLTGWKKRRLFNVLKYATKNALIWGNAYMESVDDSEARWAYGSPAGTALGAGSPRPLISFEPATKFYGLKQIDPRTMRVFISPSRFDAERAEPFCEKFVQRRWQGPLGPTPSSLLESNVEIDFHPDQVLHLRFNRLPGGIYGYSMYRETIWALKGYMVMLQYLPAIVQKRADPLLHVRFGKDRVLSEDGREKTYLPSPDDFAKNKSLIANRAPGEDIFSDILTDIVEVYKSGGGPLAGIQEYIQAWKERILVGLGIPGSLFDVIRQGSEVKWGMLKFEVLEDEIREYQLDLEDLINEKIIPRLTSGEAEFHFNPITPEDWRANVAPLLDLYKTGVISGEYVRDRLEMPAQAGKGTMYTGPQPSPLSPSPAPGLPRQEETR